MAADSANVPFDTEMAECDGDKVVTMMDVLQEQQDFEEDANAVLGASDDNNCTFSQGYIKRQAIYACLTCCADVKTDPTKRAGVCLACSLNCHENHELVELYTKRNFRCDCGNPKFNPKHCQFTHNKNEINSNNVYNQNFSGLYCTCHRPYPDPENTVEDDMIQCIICEDWHHASHLNTIVPANNQYSEMICKGCMDKNEFLHDYSNFAINTESIDVDVVTINGENDAIKNCNSEGIANGIDNSISDNKDATDKTDEITHESTNAQVETESKKNAENHVDNSMDTECLKEDFSSNGKNTEQESAEFNNDEGTHAESKNTSDIENDRKSTVADNEAAETFETPQDPAIESQEQKDISMTNENIELTANLSSEQTTREDSESFASNETKPFSEDTIEGTKVENPTNIIEKQLDSRVEKPISEDPIASTQQNHPEKDNSDAVMDAIDELLEGPKELNAEIENRKELDEELSINNDDNQTETRNTLAEDHRTVDTEGPVIDTNEESNTDIELNSNKNINESSQPSTDSQIIENKSQSDTYEKSGTAEQNEITNSDNCHKNIALNETGSTSKLDNDSPVTDEPSFDNKASNLSTITNENKRKLNTELIEETNKKAKLDNRKCVRPKGVKKNFKGATFWPSNFRQALCTCEECLKMYKDLNVLFLTDLEDTVSFYESLGKQNVDAGASQYERGLQALSSLDRIQQINALTEYNNMRDRLLDFLKSFKDRQEIVKEEDIRAFFAGMRPRREPDGVYFCR